MQRYLRHSTPPSCAAVERHRLGFSCGNPCTYVYDANGHGRWCSTCGAELGEASYAEFGGADFPAWAIGLVVAAMGLILLGVVFLVRLGGQSANQQEPVGTGAPSHAAVAPYGPPDANPTPIVVIWSHAG